MTDEELRELVEKCKQYPTDESFRLQLADEIIKLYDEMNGDEE